MYSKIKILSLILIFQVLNCSSFSGFYLDRKNDSKDLFDISFGAGISIGGKVYTGKYSSGIILSAWEYRIALDRGEAMINFQERDMGFGIGFKSLGGNETIITLSNNKEKFFRKRKLDEDNIRLVASNVSKVDSIALSTNNPRSLNSRIGFKIAFIASLEFAIYTGEIADFFLGWFGADIYNDDYNKNIDKMKEEL